MRRRAGGGRARRIFRRARLLGAGLGGVYTFCMNTLGLWPGQPDYQPKWLPGASISRCTITSEYLGVGYIIGPRVAGTLFAGGVISWLVLMPAIRFFGSLAPNVRSVSQHDSDSANDSRPAVGQLHSADGRGRRGRVGTDHAAARRCRRLLPRLRAGMKDVRAKTEAAARRPAAPSATFPCASVVVGSVVIVAMMWALLKFKPIPGAQTGASRIWSRRFSWWCSDSCS